MQNVNYNLYLHCLYTQNCVSLVTKYDHKLCNRQNCTLNPIHVVISHPSREKEKENTRNLMEIDMHTIVEQNYFFNEHVTCFSHESLPLQISWLQLQKPYWQHGFLAFQTIVLKILQFARLGSQVQNLYPYQGHNVEQ